MRDTPISYKTIDPRCEVRVREINRHQAARRLIAANRRRPGAAGLVIAAPEGIAAGALVEIDVVFPGSAVIYRSKGVVDWVSDERASKREMGVVVFGMDKVDPAARSTGSTQPSSPDTPAAAGPVESQTAVVTHEQVADAVQHPEGDAAVSEPQREETNAAHTAPKAAQPAPAADSEAADGPPGETSGGMIVPDPEDVAELLGGLVDGAVSVTRAADALQPDTYRVVAEYCNDDGVTTYLIALDLPAADYLGAALVMLPAQSAKTAVEEGKVTDELRESLQEVCNIAASLFNDAGNPHVRFTALHMVDALPEAVADIVAHPTQKIDLTVDIEGYGSGKMALLDSTG